MPIESATLLGSSSGRNAGDATLISGLMDAVDQTCSSPLHYEIPTLRPDYIATNYTQHHTTPVSMMPWSLSLKMLGLPTYRSIMKTDLTLIFDAILFDRSLYNPLFNFLSTLYLLLPKAKKNGKRMGFYNVGAGPVNTAHGQKMLRTLSDMMDFITVRDEDSWQILTDLGVDHPKMILGADAALNVRASEPGVAEQILQGKGMPPDQPVLGINVNTYLDTWAGPDIKPMGKETFVKGCVEALNRVLKDIEVPLVFVTTQHHDIEISQTIMSRLESKEPVALVTNKEYNHYDIKAVLGRLDLLFGMRLHSLILASSEMAPILGLAYQPKVRHYLNSLGMESECLGFEDFSADNLYRHIREGWERRATIKEHLRERVPLMKERAMRAAQWVADLRADRPLTSFNSNHE